MDYLSSQYVKACTLCDHTGFVGARACSCLLRTRAEAWMISGGFSERILQFVQQHGYSVPELVSGSSVLDFVAVSADVVLDKGLSLYVYSMEAGRGKTTLAYHIMFQWALYFLDTVNYRPGLTFAFENVNDLLERSLSFKAKSSWDATFYVLDDLGNEDRSTAMRRDAIVPLLQRVLHYRQDHMLPTLITSNYRPEDLCGLYHNRLDSLLELNVDGTIGGNVFRQIEVGGGENLRTLDTTSSWPEGV